MKLIMIKAHGFKSFADKIEINVDDKIITLSTCYLNSNNRLVIQAKLEN